MTRTEELFLYRKFEDAGLFENMIWIMENVKYAQEDDQGTAVLRSMYFETLGALVEMAGTYGFEGNLWHNYLTYLLVNH